MGTPASVACDPPQGQAPAAQTRKRGSANIFRGVGLGQLQRLFRSRGDERADERARLVWEAAGDQRVAQALRQLRPRHRAQLSLAAQGGRRVQTLQPFGYPRPEDRSTPTAAPGSSMGLEGPSRARQPPALARKDPRSRQRKRGPGPTGYLHQLQQ